MTDHLNVDRTAAELVNDQGGFPEQEQQPPGLTGDMHPVPDHGEESWTGHDRLHGLRALITGGDSGIGRAVAIAFAREGCDVAINYLPEEQPDAEETKKWVEEAGRRCVLVPADLTDEQAARSMVRDAVGGLGGLDIVVNNAGFQWGRREEGLASVTTDQMDRVNETHFWGPDPSDPSQIKRFGRVQDVRDGLSEFPHVIVNQARLLDFLLEFMAGSPSRLKVDYSHELVSMVPPKNNDGLSAVTLKTPEGEKVVKARYVVGCDGAHSRVRESIGRIAQGYGADKAWGVMDLLAVTDFPEIRFKCTIQSGDGGNILLIPREGGHLFRLYVDMGEIAADAWLTEDEVLAKANSVLSQFSLDVKEVAWFSVYRVGHRVTDKFDDVDEAEVGQRAPQVFIAGDACHTHTAKAGQGMNVSMQDTFNLGWKLAAVLHGRSPESLLDTYSAERKVIAQDLIDMDTRWSQAIGGAGRVDSSDRKAVQSAFAEVERQFVKNGEFTAGLATQYAPSLLTGDDTHLHLAQGYPPGRRFQSQEVIRMGDGKRVHLGHVHKADGRWRLYAFADVVDPRNHGSKFSHLMDFLASDDSPVAKHTPKDWPTDGVFDVRGIIQQSPLEIDWCDMHDFLKPKVGKHELVDYEKCFAPVDDRDSDIFDVRQIDRGQGALVVVRPDQYVSLVLPLEAHDELTAFFAGFMNEL